MSRVKLRGYRVLNTHGDTKRGDLVVEGEPGEAEWRLPNHDNIGAIFQETDEWPSENAREDGFKNNILAVGVVTENDEPIFVIDSPSVERLKQMGAVIDRAPLEIYPTAFFSHTYWEQRLPCSIDGKELHIDIVFDRFVWLQGECMGNEHDDGSLNGEPHGIRAISTESNCTYDMTVLSPVAQRLLKLGLVEGAPKETDDAV